MVKILAMKPHNLKHGNVQEKHYNATRRKSVMNNQPEQPAFKSKDKDIECPECRHTWPLMRGTTVGNVTFYCPECGVKFRIEGKK